ncbi:fungal protein [Schizosaccharomyces cryophilus OY26]|uniref:Fungal protein n=1 Tax=Schizosaccharomyces cryophilus (strain OY26 / ATCC MYA-4695 / CBS 11777 / NBRC 106824 / NRRL Y48691) TaxID=653667 RepID=S9VXV6_SCHCR|nr:uncharacterized protein SPOG_02228 [Schizosaccharomyces cryophilus OY26]EPY51049.1 fungal protein [Schizosaccharomyces cryophilus OY26]
MPDLAHQIAGHKAALHNPSVSEEAKARAQEWLDSHGDEAHYTTGTTRGYKADRDDEAELRKEGFQSSNLFENDEAQAKNLGNVRGGYKAAMKNKRNTKSGREAARKSLDEIDDEANA